MRPDGRADHRCIDLAQSRVQQRRVPQSPVDLIKPAKSDSCQTRVHAPARRLSVKFEAQYQAFVRSAVVSCAALSAFALNLTCLWNLCPAGLSFEITGHPYTSGANQPCSDAAGKVVAPNGYSKRFFSI
jgi:hypothetical protein